MKNLIVFLSLLAGSASAQTADCIIQPSQILRVGSPVTGIVSEIAVERGDWVGAGDMIARLETSLQDMAIRSAEARASNRAELAAAQARRSFAQNQLDRQRGLFARNVISDAQLQEAETALLVAESELLIAEEALAMAAVDLDIARAERDRRTIRSPLSGTITSRELEPGEYWAEAQAIATIAAVDPLYVEAIVPMEAFGRIKPGDTALVLPEDVLDTAYPAVVVVADQVLDAASGTFGVRLELANPDREIPAGLRCRVEFDAQPAAPLTPGGG